MELFFWSWSAPKQALVERSDQRSTHVTLSLTTANHSHKQNQMISPKDMLLKPIYRCLANDKNTLPLSIQPKYPQGHATFTTLLHLDATFAMIPSALHHRHPNASDVPPVLRPKPANLPMPGIEAQAGTPATSDVDACSASAKL